MAKKLNSRGKNNNQEHTVSSFDVLTQIFPPMTSVNKTNLFNDDKDKFPTSNNVVEIQNGHYLRGQLEKSMFASTSKGILHRICNDFGNRTCADFIDDIQDIINEYMKTSSFSVGISDLIANKTTQREITRIIETQKQEVQLLIEKVQLGIFENKTANSNAAEFELQVNNLLNKALGDAGKIGRSSLGKDNRFVMIVDSGSKGSPHNISQMISCFGQQNIDGKRIPNGFDNRPLPHFCKYDDSPKARGFIENSYITGLTAVEVFYHAMGGRIGLIDTAVKTSQTGYIQRRWVKAMEDLVVRYDMTVRNNMGKIIQFRYGDDGFDPVNVERQNLSLLNSSIEDIFSHYDIIGVNDQTGDELSFLNTSLFAHLDARLC
jgi:DNA-directed RNA polymerase II subunit RPB1